MIYSNHLMASRHTALLFDAFMPLSICQGRCQIYMTVLRERTSIGVPDSIEVESTAVWQRNFL